MSSEPDDPIQHYFSEEPDVPSARQRIEVTLPDGSFPIETDTGVFSHGRVDSGTKFLLVEAPELPATGHLLDLGCGAGPIAITATESGTVRPAAASASTDDEEGSTTAST
mgnify:CR=1 FL=1